MTVRVVSKYYILFIFTNEIYDCYKTSFKLLLNLQGVILIFSKIFEQRHILFVFKSVFFTIIYDTSCFCKIEIFKMQSS